MSGGHPCDPLSAGEVESAVAAILAAHPEVREARFPLLTLEEPPKDAVYAVVERSAAAPPRRALVIVFDVADGATFEAVVDLVDRDVVRWDPKRDVQPSILLEEVLALQDIARRDPGVRAALALRGVTEDDLVQFDPWTAGVLPIDGVEGNRRLLRATASVRRFPTDNPYAHPVENLVIVVDLIERRVVKVIDDGVVPIPAEPGNYDAGSVGELRADLRPIEISQPEGPSFTIDGNLVTWQRWSAHVSMHPVEGLLLRDVRYRDGDRSRPILYRAGLSEMVVPYGDPAPTFGFRSVFDAGEYSLGRFAAPLRLGCDCLGEIRYLDAVLADEAGRPMTISNAICVHEEDVGALWRHWDFLAADEAEVRRSRRLVVSSFHTLGNYEYGFFWYLYLDGTIAHEIKLTGVLQTKAIASGETTPFGTEVAPDLEAPNHQHLFCVRLDLDIEGPSNTVVEVDAVGWPRDGANPYGTAFGGRSTVIGSERDAGRAIDPSLDRVWKVLNAAARNRLGQPVAYRLIPHAGPLLAAAPDSHVADRAGFARHHVWVTRYDPSELRAAGDYVNQRPGGDGLPRWVEQDRSLENEDVVLWHVFGTSHLPRPEDWPVMPVQSVGFRLEPVGFFDRNPALDIPPRPGN
jgi:primary-amine oxidase